MIEIKGNDVKFKDSLKINFLGVAILKQDFVFEITYTDCSPRISETYESNPYVKSCKKVMCKDLPEDNEYRKYATKPKYHCYLLLDIGSILCQPIIFWSMEYKDEKSVREIIELCNSTAKAIIKKRIQKKTTAMAGAIADFKLKYGKQKIPIRMIDMEQALKLNLPGIADTKHQNRKQFI